MSLKSNREQIALEINLYGTDNRISSVHAAKKIIEYLSITFPFDVLVPIDVIVMTTLIRNYRNGTGLETTVDEVIKSASILASLDSVPDLVSDGGPFVYNNSGAVVGQAPIWNTLPGLVQLYVLGEFYLKSGLGAFNSFEFIECLGQDVFLQHYPFLHAYIQSDVAKFESDANIICQRYHNVYTFQCPSSISFNVPNAPDFCIRAVS